MTHSGDVSSVETGLASGATSPVVESLVLFYIVAIVGAEVVAVRVGIVPATLCHAIIVFLLLLHYMRLEGIPHREALPVLALAPLLRILSVTMPLGQVPQIYWYALIGLPLLISTALTVRLLRVTWTCVGLGRSRWDVQALIALGGLPLSVIAYLILRPRPVIAAFTWGNLASGSLILIVFVGFAEELVFRGVLQRAILGIFGPSGILLSAVIFAAMYTGASSPAYTLFMGGVGLYFGWCVYRTGSLWGVVMAHSILVIGLACIWPFVWLPR